MKVKTMILPLGVSHIIYMLFNFSHIDLQIKSTTDKEKGQYA